MKIKKGLLVGALSLATIGAPMIAPIANAAPVMAADKLPTSGQYGSVISNNGSVTTYYADGTMTKVSSSPMDKVSTKGVQGSVINGNGSVTTFYADGTMTKVSSNANITDGMGTSLKRMTNLSNGTHLFTLYNKGTKLRSSKSVYLTKKGNYYMLGTSSNVFAVKNGKLVSEKATGANNQLWELLAYSNGQTIIRNVATKQLITGNGNSRTAFNKVDTDYTLKYANTKQKTLTVMKIAGIEKFNNIGWQRFNIK